METPVLIHRDSLAERRVEVSSLVDLLRWRAERQAGKELYTFLSDATGAQDSLTYVGLDLRARAIGAWLQEAGMSGERVLLLFPPGLEYIAAFFGCLYAGAVAVPAYPPRPNRSLDRLQAVINDAQPAAALTTNAILSQVGSGPNQTIDVKALRWATTSAISDSWAEGWQRPKVEPDTLAFLQYTSGSTAKPKGVMVTHQNLLHNESMIQRAFHQTERSVIIGWLPLFHDMGLIGNVLQPLYIGARCILLSPASFLQRPLMWLETISRYRGTTSGGPNFAYDLCARKIRPEQREALDLSSWSVAFNGSEPVNEGTLNRFAAAFESCGFSRQAFYPCYGLAEATLFVSGGLKMTGPAVRSFERAALAQNRSEPASIEDESAHKLVSCGKPWLGQQIRIVEPELLTQCPPGRVGEIWVAGPSVAQGYWGQPEESRRTFQAYLTETNEGPYLRTGDLGLIQDGELYITGRLKDLIIIRGRNYYPQGIEATVGGCDAALPREAGAAFSIDFGGEERLVIVQEIDRRHRQQNLPEIVKTIRQAVAEAHELQVHAIAIIKHGTLLKTSSGKIQRRAIKDAFENGTLDTVIEWRAADHSEPVQVSVSAAPPPGSLEEIQEWIASRVVRTLGLIRSEIDLSHPILRYGLDSLASIELAHAIEATFSVSLPLLSFLQDLSISQLAAQVLGQLDEQAASPVLPVARAERRDSFPLSQGQKALWFLYNLAPGSAAYNVIATAKSRDRFDVAALGRTFQTLLDRHASLRTRFESRDGIPAQIVQNNVEVSFHVEDASHLTQAELCELIEAEAYRPFDLENGPVFRASVFRQSDDEHLLVLAAHHIVIDFWSLAVLIKEMSEIYEAEISGGIANLPPPEVSYADYVSWQEQLLESEPGEQLWQYWQQQLSGVLPHLELPTDFPRPPVQTYKGASESIRLSRGIRKRLKELAVDSSTTIHTVLLAAYQAFLYRHTGQSELLIGSPTLGRSRSIFQATVGYFVNPVVIRASVSADLTFRQILTQTRETVLSALEHQDYPFALLVDRLHPERDPARSPLFQTAFVFEKAPSFSDESLAAFALGVEGARLKSGSLMLESVKPHWQVAQFDMTMAIAQVEDGLEASLQYNTDLFSAATIKRMLDRFKILVEGIITNAGERISELPLLTQAERHQLLLGFNDTSREYNSDACIHHLFEAQVERTPDSIAITYRDEHLTYRQLNARANQLAHYLRELGVEPESCVGILMDRSIDMLVSMLAVLKAGGAYLPLDPAYPAERLSFMMEDTAVRVVLSRQVSSAQLTPSKATLIGLNNQRQLIERHNRENPRGALNSQNLAYVIYTSGSTGQPKGVAIGHRCAVNFLAWAHHTFSFEELSAVLASTSICFDLSIFELFAPLSVGGTVILAENALQLASHTAAARVTLINTVPSAMAELLRLKAVSSGVRTINLAGEPLKNSLAQDTYAQTNVERVLNLYGPTEYTTYTTGEVVERGAEQQPSIGRPITNTRVYIVDTRMEPVPVGAVGEICIGGEGLARCYLNRPDMTAERFIPDNREVAGGRLYRTGDIGRYLEDGQIEYLGRKDQQVKIRGYRIELGEIESALSRNVAVKDAAVVVAEDGPGEKRLIAYVVNRPQQHASAVELRDHLKKTLPHYMVPSLFVILQSMPLTRNGKIDRRALPAPQGIEPEAAQEAARHQTPIEEVVAGIWAEVLGLKQVHASDNFFDLGGHSLKTTQVISRLSDLLHLELPLRSLFEAPRLRDFAKIVEEAMISKEAAARPAIQRVARNAGLPLSFAQQRLWFINRMEPGSAAYNVAFSVSFTGRLNLAALEQSVNEIIRRHEALRTAFAQTDQGPAQIVAAHLAVRISFVDLRNIFDCDSEALAERLVCEEARLPFNLEQGPLLRMTLLQLSDEKCVLALNLHHIVCDGWSCGVFIQELASHYAAFSCAMQSEEPDLLIQYPDFAAWERQWAQAEAVQTQLSYWKQHLSGAPALLELPTDRPRPPVRSSRGKAVSFALSRELAANLRGLSRQQGATLFMTLLAAFQTLLSRYSGQSDVLVGTPVAYRNHAAVEKLIGYFVNTLVMRADLSSEPTFLELLRRVRETSLGAYANQDAPFEKLLTEMNAGRDLSRAPLFQVMMVLQNTPLGRLTLNGMRLQPRETETATSKFDMTMQLIESEDGVAGRWEYSTDLFDETTIQRMITHFQTLLEDAVTHPQKPICDLRLLAPAERQHLLSEWNGAAEEHFQQQCLHELFEQQVNRAPDAVAAVCEDKRLSYAELNSRANQLSHHLRGSSVGPEKCVAILMERSVEMVVAILAVLKAGSAYVPLDPEYPEDRIAYVMEDCGASAVITQSSLSSKLPASLAVRRLIVDTEANEIARCSRENPRIATTAENLAYVIYTSGSTGRPKGVLVTNHNVTRLFLSAEQWFDFNRQDVWTLFHSFAFDFSVWELWGALLYGGRVAVVPYWVSRSPEDFYHLLRRERVTVLNQIPTAFYQLTQAENSIALGGGQAEIDTSLRLIVFGGEALEIQSLRPWFERHGDARPQLINMYGITETTVHVTYRPIRMDDLLKGAGSVIGRGIGDLQVYVLDERMEPVPIGVAGELFVGGAGVARGYLNRSELTAERFVPAPFGVKAGARLYRTGDVGRYLASGEIEYLGRRDQQVKVRGFRIELGEIEAALAARAGVRGAVVAVREDERKRKHLVAYALIDSATTINDLRAYLLAKLPAYMVPTAFVSLERFPLTPSGKIDRKALPDPERESCAEQFMPPRTPTEKLLASVWSKVLQVEQVSIHDNFFDLGGDSILSIQVISQARRAGLSLTPQLLFQYQTIAELAAVTKSAAATGPERSPATMAAEDFARNETSQRQLDTLMKDAIGEELEDIYPLTPLQQGMLFHILKAPNSRMYLNQQRYTLQGELDVAAFKAAYRQVIDRHQILRTAFVLASNGEPFQVVYRDFELVWDLFDWRDLSETKQQENIEAFLKTDRQQGFDLSKAPLMRLALIQLGADGYEFIWSFHLMLLDGWSIPIILKEVIAFYDAIRQDRAIEIEPPRPYGDYIGWLQRQDRSQAEAYWRQTLAGFTTPTHLGDDRAPEEMLEQQEDYREQSLLLNEAHTTDLRSFSGLRKLTLNTLAQAAWALILSRRSGSDDVVFGSVVSGRSVDFPGAESTVGLFINTLPVRVRAHLEAPLLPWLKLLQTQQADARLFEFCSLVDIQGWSDVPRGQHLFQSILIFQNIPIDISLSEPERKLKLVEMKSTERTNYPLTVIIEPGSRLLIKMVYDGRQFESATIARMLEQIRGLLLEMAADPDARLSAFSTISEAERGVLIESFNQSLEVL